MLKIRFGLPALCAGIFLLAAPSYAQFSWVLYGSVNPGSTSATNRGTIYQINSTTGAESVAVNLLSFSLFSSKTFQGVNGLAYDRTLDRVYFTLNTTVTDGRGSLLQGQDGVYFWNRSNNTVGTLFNFSGVTTPDQNAAGTTINRQINADNAAIYNGFYYFVQDQGVDSTPELYRINLSSPTAVERLQDFNGSNTRNYYDFGDIAISSGGILSGSAGDARGGTRNNWFFQTNISGSTGSTMSSTGYSETTPSTTTNLYQMGYSWQDRNTMGSTLIGQDSNASGGGSQNFFQINPTTGAEIGGSLFTGARLYADLTSAPILIPEPATMALFGLGAIGLPLLRRRYTA